MDSATVQHAKKVNGALDILKGILAGLSMEKLCVANSHTKTEKKAALHSPKDSR